MQEVDQPTRDRVSREILQQGPVTARELAGTLGLTPAAVRRHLDGLEAQGLVDVHETPDGSPRGRGRPARRYVLSDSGHATMSAQLDQQYDHLAAHVLEYLSRTMGPEAVEGFARERAERLASRYRPAVEAAGTAPGSRAEALADVLSEDGYAAAVRSSKTGTQLCQGHCPVQHVAARFPQLCEAETQAFSTLLGVHVQRLATLAHGEHVCTTHIPAPTPAAPPAPDVPREKRADDHRVAS